MPYLALPLCIMMYTLCSCKERSVLFWPEQVSLPKLLDVAQGNTLA
jgi:hypothetical protein